MAEENVEISSGQDTHLTSAVIAAQEKTSIRAERMNHHKQFKDAARSPDFERKYSIIMGV